MTKKVKPGDRVQLTGRVDLPMAEVINQHGEVLTAYLLDADGNRIPDGKNAMNEPHYRTTATRWWVKI